MFTHTVKFLSRNVSCRSSGTELSSRNRMHGNHISVLAKSVCRYLLQASLTEVERQLNENNRSCRYRPQAYSGRTLEREQAVTSSKVRLHCQSGPNIGSGPPREVLIAIVVPAATRTTAVSANNREVVQLTFMALPSSGSAHATIDDTCRL